MPFLVADAEGLIYVQISELHFQSQQLEDDNGILAEKNAQSVADIERLREQLAELMKENQMREAHHSEKKSEVGITNTLPLLACC